MPQNNQQNIVHLQELLNEAREFENSNPSDPDFDTWIRGVERYLTKIYGNDSIQLRQFKELNFCCPALPPITDLYNPAEDPDTHRRDMEFFRDDLEKLINYLSQFIQEFDE